MNKTVAGRYTTITARQLHSELSDRAVRLWLWLRLYAGESNEAVAYHKTLAGDLRCSLATVKRALEELRAAGWIEFEDTAAVGGPRAYQLRGLPAWAPNPSRMALEIGRQPVAESVAEPAVTQLTGELPPCGNELPPSSPVSYPPPEDSSYPQPGQPSRPHTPPADKTAGQEGGSSPVSYRNKNQELLDLPSVDLSSPPVAGLSKRDLAQRQRDREQALDPVQTLGLWDLPEVAQASGKPAKVPNADTPYGLALDWRYRMTQARVPGGSNLKALASTFKVMLALGTTPNQIRQMSALYAATPGLRKSSVLPHVDFIGKRNDLLVRVLNVERQQQAQSDPAAYYADSGDGDHAGLAHDWAAFGAT